MSGPPEPGWHALRVARIVEETPDARTFVLEVPEALRERFRYRAGQFLTFTVPWGDGALGRCYSLSTAPDCDAELAVTVKRIEAGRVSSWFHDALAPGAELRVLPPAGRFVLRPESRGPLLLFSAGSGITPVFSILKSALATTLRPVRLVYANRDRDSIIFRGEIDALAQRHRDRLRVVHHLDVEHGFLDQEGVRELVAGQAGADHYLCGPAPFMEVVERALAGLGVERERIFIERFASPSDGELPAERNEAPAAVLTLHLDRAIHEVACGPGETILAAARRIGLNPPSACEDGYCGCCMAKLLRGRVEMARCQALDPAEVAEGWVLTCQSRPLTAECEVEWD